MIAVAACAASVFRVSTSSLLSGSRPSLRPTPSTAITSPLTRQGKSHARPEAASVGVARRALVDVHGLAGRQPRRGAALPAAIRGRPSPVRGTPRLRNGDEVAGLAGQEERHLAQAERRADALEQPLARPLEVEVGVEVLGEAHERLARAVALLVEEPVERLLDPRLDRA